MKILLVAEGVHELSGALEALIRRVMGEGAALEVETADVRDPCVRINTTPGKGGRLKKRIVRWALEAEKRGFAALVLLVDEDGDRDRRAQVREANEATGMGAARAAGVAIRTIDAWMLADEGAMSRVLGTAVSAQKSPEEIRDGKGMFEGQRACVDTAEPVRDCYRRIAEEVNLERGEGRGPKGLGAFAEGLRLLSKRLL